MRLAIEINRTQIVRRKLSLERSSRVYSSSREILLSTRF
jgi:hypothetical protein